MSDNSDICFSKSEYFSNIIENFDKLTRKKNNSIMKYVSDHIIIHLGEDTEIRGKAPVSVDQNEKSSSDFDFGFQSFHYNLVFFALDQLIQYTKRFQV